MTPLDNLRRIVAGWRGEWRVDAHDGITLSHDGDEWPIASMDGDAVIMLVELLNAIRPAVDGATAEIERLTAELAAAHDKIDHLNEWLGANAPSTSPPRTDTAAIAADMLECAEAWAPMHRLMGNVRADEIAAVCREPAAARAVPPDVEAAIKSTVDGAEEAGRCAALGHAYLITKAPCWTVPRLKAAIARAISDATASQPATVGGLLATAPVGSIVECRRDGEDRWAQVKVAEHGRYTEIRAWADGQWWSWMPASMLEASTISKPARLVPAHLADADPASRGELLVTVDRCGVCAQITTNQNHEPVGAGLPLEPTCDACLAPEHRPEVPDVR